MHVLTNAEKLIPLRDAASLAESRRLAGMRMVTGTTSPSTRYERISVSPASCSIKSEYVIASHAFKPQYKCINYTPAWEQRKLGELCAISKGHGYSKADIRDAGTPLILYGRLYTQYESRIDDVDTFAVEQEGSLLSKGNEVIVPASGETAEDIAVASSVRRSGIIFGGDLNVVTPVSKLDPDYTALAITYSKAHDDLAKRAQGKSVVHVHGNDIAEVEVSYPSESEQKRISTAVLGLDNLITLHQRKRQWLKWLDEGGEGTHHDIDILVFKFADDMKISVLCGVHACMTKSLGHTGNRYAGKQQQRGMGVP